jgi:hypothetical protein
MINFLETTYELSYCDSGQVKQFNLLERCEGKS